MCVSERERERARARERERDPRKHTDNIHMPLFLSIRFSLSHFHSLRAYCAYWYSHVEGAVMMTVDDRDDDKDDRNIVIVREDKCRLLTVLTA